MVVRLSVRVGNARTGVVRASFSQTFPIEQVAGGLLRPGTVSTTEWRASPRTARDGGWLEVGVCSLRLESSLSVSARSSSVLRYGLPNLRKYPQVDRRSIQGQYPWQILYKLTHKSININVSSSFCITYGTYPEVLPLLLLQTVYLPNVFLRLSLSIHPPIQGPLGIQ